MIPRIGLDLEPGLQISKVLVDLDLLDVAYGAAHGGALALMAPISAFGAGTPYSADLFFRTGLPMLTIKAEAHQHQQVLGMGSAPDRVLLTGERGKPLSDFSAVGTFVQAVAGFSQEVGALVEPEPTALRELSRGKANWAFFNSESLYRAETRAAAENEIARLTSATVTAEKLHLRVALYGPTGIHLPATFSSIPHLEEVFPTPDLWNLALRLGWERAVSEYRNLM